LMEPVAELTAAVIDVPEASTAGTPAFLYSLSYAEFRGSPFLHRVSPGTVVYSDCTSLMQLSQEYGYRPAAVVAPTVVSRPTVERITCDAGHKTVSADMGVPTCAVLGRPDLRPLGPSEEHLPLELLESAVAPTIGDTLYLVPRHVCPTVNNFDYALIVEGGRITGIERVTARGREGPLLVTVGLILGQACGWRQTASGPVEPTGASAAGDRAALGRKELATRKAHCSSTARSRARQTKPRGGACPRPLPVKSSLDASVLFMLFSLTASVGLRAKFPSLTARFSYPF